MLISDLQISQVNNQIQALRKAGSFYGKKLEESGISGITTPEEFESLPFSEKNDLREAYPLGLMTAPEEDIVRIHSSSGTTGLPVIIPYTAKDVDDWLSCSPAVMKLPESPIRTVSRLLQAMVFGLPESDSRTALRSSARW